MADDHDHLNLSNVSKVQKRLSSDGQFHIERILFSANVQKINRKNKLQDRILAITSKRALNFKRTSKNEVGLKREIALVSIVGITSNTASDEFILHVRNSYDYYYKSPRKEEIIQLIPTCVSAPFYIWEKNQASIANFVTQKCDAKRNRSNMPPIAEAVNSRPQRSESLVPQMRRGPMDDYDVLRTIGQGKTGVVYLVQDKRKNTLHALKVIRKDPTRAQISERERLIIERVQSPYLARIDATFETPTDIVFVMEFLKGNTLGYHINKQKQLREDQTRFYASEILLGLAKLHEANIAYRDLSPNSVLLNSQGHACLTDFALAKALDERSQARTYVGTPEYLAPEVIQGAGYCLTSDWWSFGILIYEMLVGISPFFCHNIPMMYRQIIQGELRFSNGIPLSADAKDLISHLLDRNPNSRLGVRGAVDIQSHPFFHAVNWQQLLLRRADPPNLEHLNTATMESEGLIAQSIDRRKFESFS